MKTAKRSKYIVKKVIATVAAEIFMFQTFINIFTKFIKINAKKNA